MSSIVKDILMRSTANDAYARKLMHEKFGDQVDLLRVHPRPIRASWWTQASGGCHGSRIEASGFVKPKTGSRLRAQAVLTPISDPTSTTKKVRCANLYTVCVCMRAWLHLSKNWNSDQIIFSYLMYCRIKEFEF